MKQCSTLRNTWFGTVHGYPIKVEEHQYDLSYIVEFYDATDEQGERCITHDPITGEELVLAHIQREQSQVATES